MAMAASTSVGAPVCGSAVATVDAVEGVEAGRGPPLPVLDGGEGVELGVTFVVGEPVEASVDGGVGVAVAPKVVVLVDELAGTVDEGAEEVGAATEVDEDDGGTVDVDGCDVDGGAVELVVAWHGWITPPFV